MGKIISHYLFKETATTWLAVTVILLIILVANKFSDVLGDAAIGLLSSDSIMGLMLYSSIDYLIVLIPLSTFLSILLVFWKCSNWTKSTNRAFSISRFLVFTKSNRCLWLFSSRRYMGLCWHMCNWNWFWNII